MKTIKVPGGEISFTGKATEEGTLEIYPFGTNRKNEKICVPIEIDDTAETIQDKLEKELDKYGAKNIVFKEKLCQNKRK